MVSRNDVQLGNTRLTVSCLSFGTVYMGPQGDKLSPSTGGALKLVWGFFSKALNSKQVWNCHLVFHFTVDIARDLLFHS